MLNFIVMLAFSVLYRKDLCWANLVERLETVCLRWNLISSLLQICWIYSGVHLVSFRLEIPFLGKFCQDCLLKMEVCTYTNLNRLNLVVMLISSTFSEKYLFLVTLIQKIKVIFWGKNLIYIQIRFFEFGGYFCFLFWSENIRLTKILSKNAKVSL